jgi:hypothetical protein
MQRVFKSTNLQEAEKDTLALIGSYMNTTLYYDQYKDDQAIPYFKILSIIKTIDDFELKEKLLNMAVVEENRKSFPLALTYRKEAETWKDLNNQNRRQLPNWKRSLQLRRNKRSQCA